MMYVIAVFIPPLAALLTRGFWAFLLNLVLIIFMWLPAIIHAVYLVAKRNQEIIDDKFLRAVNMNNSCVHRETR